MAERVSAEEVMGWSRGNYKKVDLGWQPGQCRSGKASMCFGDQLARCSLGSVRLLLVA